MAYNENKIERRYFGKDYQEAMELPDLIDQRDISSDDMPEAARSRDCATLGTGFGGAAKTRGE